MPGARRRLRAEVIRFLLTLPATGASVQQVAQATAFAKRNIAETLDGLVAAGLVSAVRVADERRYHLDRDAWARILGLDQRGLPGHQAWPPFLGAMRRILRWAEALSPSIGFISRDECSNTRSDCEPERPQWRNRRGHRRPKSRS